MFRIALKPPMLRLHYPRSFTVLLLVAFALVTLPLLGGMLNAAHLLEQIMQQKHLSVATTVQVTRASRQLVDGVSALQRAVGQYYVLEDPALRQGVAGVHRQFQDSIATLRGMPLDPGQRTRLEAIAYTEAGLFRQLGDRPGGRAEWTRAIAPRFDRLHEMALAMSTESYRVIDRQTAAMERTAEAARKSLFMQALAMVPLSLFLALLFSWLINRPVMQLARAIRRLGENDLAPGPAHNGPRDLVYLGSQIDWLRLRLIELEEQKIRFLRHVSHELKTPLTALREGVELLADKVGGELTPHQEEITDIMRSNARELQRRIEDLVRYSRIVQRPDPLLQTVFSLDELLSSVRQRQDLAIRAKGLHVRMRAQGFRLKGDREKLLTVFDNLVSNAIRFSPRDGKLEVTAARTAGGRVEILVCDQGPGVPEKDRPFIFQPFYLGSVQPAGPIRGSGLGLAIVKEYVEAHAGEAALVDRPQWGACFRVELAAAQDEEA